MNTATSSVSNELQPSLIGMGLHELEALMQKLDEPKFRARQLHTWLYVHNARQYEEMTNLAKNLRAKLAERFTVGSLVLTDKQVSQDGTAKYLFTLADGQQVESVLMYFEERDVYAVCLSTQVGCAVNCDFCATGKLGFKRQLTPGEITEQLLYIRHDSKANVRNIVLMGQGEPLLNYEHTLAAIRLINQSAEIGMRHITLSTSGIIPGIHRLATENIQLTLAVSLHAPDNETRNRIMPINKKYPVEELIGALRQYVGQNGRRVTIEYILLAGVNDTQEHAQKLNQLLRGLKCNINLIPYNPIGDEYGYVRPTKDSVLAFRDWLYPSGHKVTVRIERGVDIAAACGQLQNQYQMTLPQHAMTQ